MKYRLVELLRCPTHSNNLLRVTHSNLSEVFPFSGELRLPFCRTGCGLLGNWFSEIPCDLPTMNRFNCRRCLGTEIEKARLQCPQCDFAIDVSNGVIMPGISMEKPPLEERLHIKTANIAMKLLDLKSGDLALTIAPFPESVVEKEGCNGVERVQVELQLETVISRRARSCANGHGLVHFIEGPLNTDILRYGQFDAVAIALPSPRLSDRAENILDLVGLLRPSGKMLLIYNRGESRSKAGRLEEYLKNLPLIFRSYKAGITPSGLVDLVLLEPADDRCNIFHTDHFKGKHAKEHHHEPGKTHV
jgi:hypothetical protein